MSEEWGTVERPSPTCVDAKPLHGSVVMLRIMN